MSFLSYTLVSAAQAQEAAAPAAPSPIAGMLPLVLIFVVFYFLLIRPQQKKYKQHRAMVDAVQVKDQVVTGGGIHGKVKKVDDLSVVVTIAEGVDVTVDKATLSTVVAKDAPSNDNKK